MDGNSHCNRARYNNLGFFTDRIILTYAFDRQQFVSAHERYFTLSTLKTVPMKSSKSLSKNGLWGELPPRDMIKPEVIRPDLIENVWRQVLDDSNNTDSDYRLDNNQLEDLQLPIGNLHVLNTINFHQQLRTMEEGTMLNNMTIIESQDSKDATHSKNLFRFLLYQPRGNTFKDCSIIHHLTPQTARNVLKHAVTILLAHVGFENASDIAIETLVDVADHFLRRMTLLLKVATEQRDHGFPDAVERVLLETGVGGVTALHDYYQEYVLKFEENMKKKVEDTMERQRMMQNEAASKLKFEELDEFGNVYREVPTLQLLDPEMGFPPSLDAGFQMLYSLEQDQLNSMEVEEEEVNVSDSPNAGRSDLPVDKKRC